MVSGDWIAIVGITSTVLGGVFLAVLRSMAALHKDLSKIKEELATLVANNKQSIDLQTRFWDKLSKLGERLNMVEVEIATLRGELVHRPRRRGDEREEG